MKITLLFISLIALLLFSHINALACSCATECYFPQNLIVYGHEANAVFSGKVLETKIDPKNTNFILAKMELIKSWKGNLPQEVIIRTLNDGSASCGYDFSLGENYLVFAEGSDAKELYTDICSGTRPLNSRGIAPLIVKMLDEKKDSIVGIQETVQKETKAILFDELNIEGLNVTKCPAVLSMLSMNLNNKIKSESNSKGYIIIYGNKKDPLEKYLLELYIKAGLNFLRIDKNIFVLQGEDQSESKIQFWKTLAGADIPNYFKEKWNYKLPLTGKPIKVGGDEEFGTENYHTDFFTKILLANPKLSGHFIVYEGTAKSFSKTKAKLIKQLTAENKVPRKQIKFFYKKDDNYSNLEFWLYPKAGK